MAKKEIPARTIWTCDCCASELTKSNWRLNGMLDVRADALDFSGAAVASDHQKYELCDVCFSAAKKAIIEVINGKAQPCDSESK